MLGLRLRIPEGILVLGCLDAVQLLSDDGQYLHIDAVELIKAAPAARLGQAGEELAHHLWSLPGQNKPRTAAMKTKATKEQNCLNLKVWELPSSGFAVTPCTVHHLIRFEGLHGGVTK